MTRPCFATQCIPEQNIFNKWCSNHPPGKMRRSGIIETENSPVSHIIRNSSSSPCLEEQEVEQFPPTQAIKLYVMRTQFLMRTWLIFHLSIPILFCTDLFILRASQFSCLRVKVLQQDIPFLPPPQSDDTYLRRRQQTNHHCLHFHLQLTSLSSSRSIACSSRSLAWVRFLVRH